MSRRQQTVQDGSNRRAYNTLPPPYVDGPPYHQTAPNPPPVTREENYTEHSSLLGQSSGNTVHPVHRKEMMFAIVVIVLVFSFLGSLGLGYQLNTLVCQDWHDRIVRDIDRLRADWGVEVHAHEAIRVKMHQERHEWDQEVIDMDAERRRRQAEDLREEQDRASRKKRQQEKDIRLEKERADEKRRREEEEIREEKEKAERKRLREEEEIRKEEQKERQRREEESRQRAAIVWSGLRPLHCVRYGVREYTATLTNVPLGFDPIDECRNKPIEIHGKAWFTSSCEDQLTCGRVTGHWKVDANEGGCTPWWSYFKDKGCVEPGIRRHEAPLENLHNGDNWEEMCSTTPANINGVYYDGPTSCADWGKYGKWGIWLVADSGC